MTADLVFVNGEVITVNAKNEVTESVAVKGNRIIAVGPKERTEPYVGKRTRKIDLQGRSLLPGWIDSHVHLTLYGVYQLGINCKDQRIRTLDDLLTALKRKARRTPKGAWIRAWGFNENELEDRRYPTLQELDAVTEDHPVMITRTCGHISVVNGKALEIAGIDGNTPDPRGGRIERDSSGRLTGKLIEAAHMHMNRIARFTEKEIRDGIQIASDHFLAHGITSIHEAGGFGPDNWRWIQQAVQKGDVRVRVYAMIASLNDSRDFVQKMMAAGVVTGTGDHRFKIGPAKLFLDGSSTGPTIATRQPYTSDPGNRGILYYDEDEVFEILGEAHQKGYQITAHAQGDEAIQQFLHCVERALRKHPRSDHRHRIEHAGICPPDLQRRIRELKVIPVPNPPFPYEFGDIYLRHYGERVHHMYPARDFIDRGILAAAGSDAPITFCDPLLGIHTAVNRRSREGTAVGADQRVSVMDAIRLYTWNGAYASFEETVKGSVETGKLADLVVLNGSLLQEDPERIKDLQVDMTVLDGEIVYRR